MTKEMVKYLILCNVLGLEVDYARYYGACDTYHLEYDYIDLRQKTLIMKAFSKIKPKPHCYGAVSSIIEFIED